VLMAVVGSSRRSGPKSPGWVAPTAVFAFVLACVAYYDLCRRLNLAVAWVFLVGFLPSWPLTVPLAYLSPKFRGLILTALGAVVAFTLFFWASAGCLWLRAVLSR